MLPAAKLFLNEQFSDVELKVQAFDGYIWRFPAHSTFLCSGSDWMKERIAELRLVDGENTAITTITFVDLTPDTVLLLLRYLYLGELPSFLHTDSLVEILGASVRFQIPALRSECERRILGSIRVLNVGHILERATDLMASGRGSAGIIDACRRLILRYGQIIFSSDLILQLNRGSLEYILASNKLNVVDESVVFGGLWRWGRQNCCKAGLALTEKNVIDILTDLLELVRFSCLKDTNLPGLVKDRYCSSNKSKLCCSSNGTENGQCRCSYKPPGDILHQSSRKLISAYATPNMPQSIVEAPNLNNRLLCTQISFSSSVHLTAVALDALPGDQVPGSFIITVTSEDDGQEVCRENVNAWKEVTKPTNGSGDQVLSTVLRISVPIKISGRSQYSVHLLLEEEKKEISEASSVDEIDGGRKWKFPVTNVRRNISPPDEHECHMMTHCENIVAITAVYFIPGADRIW